jgi:chromosome segregation ATPase
MTGSAIDSFGINRRGRAGDEPPRGSPVARVLEAGWKANLKRCVIGLCACGAVVGGAYLLLRYNNGRQDFLVKLVKERDATISDLRAENNRLMEQHDFGGDTGGDKNDINAYKAKLDACEWKLEACNKEKDEFQQDIAELHSYFKEINEIFEVDVHPRNVVAVIKDRVGAKTRQINDLKNMYRTCSASAARNFPDADKLQQLRAELTSYKAKLKQVEADLAFHKQNEESCMDTLRLM